MQQQGFNIDMLEQEVKTRWLRPKEVLQILQNHEWFTIAQKPAQKPPSGSWFLYNRRVLRYFRNDGYKWQKKKNGKPSNEAHERLKVDNVAALSCYYARRDENPTFQRRIYWMLDQAYEHIVFVHYRNVLEGSISVPARNDSSTSTQNGSSSRAEVHSSTGWTSELTAPGSNSYSLGSGGEVSSRTVTVNTETNNTSPSDQIQEKAALRKLEMQLSLEDKEEYDVNTEEVPSNNEPVIVHESQNEELEDCTDLNDIFNVLDFPEEHINEAGTRPPLSAIDVLQNSDTWLEDDQLEAILHSNSMLVTENQWFRIDDVCPEWGFCSENTKVIILGDFLCNPSNSCAVMFGDVKVPVETVRQGVIRCHTPCLDAGKVRMYMIDVNGKPCSEEREFGFLERPTKSMIDGIGEACIEEQNLGFLQKPTRSSDELLLLLDYVQMLFDGRGCEWFSKIREQLASPDCAFQVNQMKTYEQLDHGSTINHVMEVLLNDKFEQWLSSKVEQSSDGVHWLPRQYHTVIHTIAALGYKWPLKPLLSSGVPVNYRDANGWTALHWAAQFGREEMVAALLAAGAAAGALSHPTSEDPAAVKPASIASAFGFEGLSAFLSGQQLINHLDSLESKEHMNCKDQTSGSGIFCDRGTVWDTSTHVHGETDDQLALKDSLGAIRNAVQAAGRINEAFRVSSFTEKQERGRNSILSTHETDTASHGILENAALSIQKNFRCWKRRKEYLKIRKNVIKIQARVRARQGRNKYREFLWSVGVLEKVMMRWYKKGAGMRGFNSGAMPIDEEVEEDVVKVFRKQRVETAINQAVFMVSSIIDNPIARQQYRRMLEIYQQEKHSHEE